MSSLGRLVISLGRLVSFLDDGMILFEEVLICLAREGREVVGAV